ncbi:hypothetical protein LJC56_08035 [Christensenellaceae bacterium OttesenSCG-928-K19]|nr:hypothetical protein [Christensenellaceae bacterium OttesenSCG-928-K19]
MKKAWKVTIIAILAITLVLGNVTTALAAEGQESQMVAMSGATQSAVQITEVLPAGDVVTEQVFKLYNPNSFAIDVEYGTLNTAESSLQKTDTISIPATSTQEVTVSDPGLRGVTFYAMNVINGTISPQHIVQAGSYRGYYIYVKHVDKESGQVLAVEDKTFSVAMTGSNKTVSISPMASYTHTDGTPYKPVSTQSAVFTCNALASLDQRSVTFFYEKNIPKDYDVTAVYVNGNTTIKTETFTVKAPNGKVSVFPSETKFMLNDRDYTLQTGQASRTHIYGDGQTEYYFYYDVSAKAPERAYNISVRYKDSSGAVIAIRNVSVPTNKTITVDLPSEYAAGNGKTYEKVSTESTLQHSHKDYYKGTTYDILYKEVTGATEPYNIKINYANAATGATLKTVTKYVTQTGVSEDIDSVLSINGTTYYLAAGQATRIEHAFKDAARTYTVYYNAKGADEVKPYEITVRFRDSETNAIVRTPIKETVNIGTGARVEIPYSTGAIVLGGVRYEISKSLLPSDSSTEDNSLLSYDINGNVVLVHQFSDSRRVYDIFLNKLGRAAEGTPDTIINTVTGPSREITNFVGGGVDVIGGGTEDEADVIEPEEDDATEDDATADIPEDNPPADEGDGTDDAADENGGTVANIDDNDTPTSAFRNEDGSLKWGWIVLDIALLGIVVALAIILIKKNNQKKAENQAH